MWVAVDWKNGMDLRRIALVSVSLAVLAGAVIATPLLAHMLRQRAAREEAARYASGLSPCEPGVLHLLSLVPVADTNAITLLRAPAFSEMTALRISGGRVEHLQFDWVEPGKGGRLQATRQSDAALEPGLEQRLQLLLRADVSHAATPVPLALDGTSYVVFVPGTGCASTWSPNADSRAGRLVDLLDALDQYAVAGGRVSGRIESALQSLEER